MTRESVLSKLVKCSKCGEYFYHFRGVSDSRCESCWDDPPDRPEVNKELLSKWQEGSVTL